VTADEIFLHHFSTITLSNSGVTIMQSQRDSHCAC